MMKTIVLTTMLSCFIASYLCAQNGKMRTVQTIRFSKTIEPNHKHDGLGAKPDNATVCRSNLTAETDLEKLFFGDFNAKVEYFMLPPFEGASGLRVLRDSTDTSYVLEVKTILNFEDVQMQLNKEFPMIGMLPDQFDSLSEKEQDELSKQNNAISDKRDDERLKRYEIQTRSISITDLFAEQLYLDVVRKIEASEIEGKMDGILFDGCQATFRCVVNDQVWSLTYRVPEGDIGKLSDLCSQMIIDVESGNFDESNYIKLLKK